MSIDTTTNKHGATVKTLFTSHCAELKATIDQRDKAVRLKVPKGNAWFWGQDLDEAIEFLQDLKKGL